jgi:hypothetical protein
MAAYPIFWVCGHRSPGEGTTGFSRWGNRFPSLCYFFLPRKGVGSGWTATFGLGAPLLQVGERSHYASTTL